MLVPKMTVVVRTLVAIAVVMAADVSTLLVLPDKTRLMEAMIRRKRRRLLLKALPKTEQRRMADKAETGDLDAEEVLLTTTEEVDVVADKLPVATTTTMPLLPTIPSVRTRALVLPRCAKTCKAVATTTTIAVEAEVVAAEVTVEITTAEAMTTTMRVETAVAVMAVAVVAVEVVVVTVVEAVIAMSLGKTLAATEPTTTETATMAREAVVADAAAVVVVAEAAKTTRMVLLSSKILTLPLTAGGSEEVHAAKVRVKESAGLRGITCI